MDTKESKAKFERASGLFKEGEYAEALRLGLDIKYVLTLPQFNFNI